MKKGFELTGTDNNGQRHRYSFVKKESFKEVFLKFMQNLGFDSDNIKKQFLQTIYNDDGEEIGEAPIKTVEIIDICRNYQNKNYDIGVFYGFQRIIVVIRVKDKDKRFHMLDYLKESLDWIEIREEKQEKLNKTVPFDFRYKE